MGTSPSPSPSSSSSSSSSSSTSQSSPSPSPSPSPSTSPSTSPSLSPSPSPSPSLPPSSSPPDQSFYDSFLQYAIVSSFVLALCTGLLTWSLKRMIIVYGVGVFFTMLIVVPDWEFFTKRHFSEWIEPMASDAESKKLQKARFPILKNTAKYAKREDIHPFGILFFILSTSTCVYYTWKFVMS